jgi:hypothetical protein
LKPCQTPSHTLVLSELSLCESTALCGHIDVVVAPNTFDFFTSCSLLKERTLFLVIKSSSLLKERTLFLVIKTSTYMVCRDQRVTEFSFLFLLTRILYLVKRKQHGKEYYIGRTLAPDRNQRGFGIPCMAGTCTFRVSICCK